MIFNPKLYIFIFAGFLLAITAGLFACWIDRKVTARLQWRQGPPWYQPFMDIAKLLCKEVIVPQGAHKFSFLMAPVFGFAAILVCALVVIIANLRPDKSFLGDLIVVIYFLMIPSLSLILGAAASRNPLASLGASREIKLIMAYELPFLLAIMVPVIKTHWFLSLGNMVLFQTYHANVIASFSGGLAFIVAVFCTQAKLGFVPFDMPEAETEIMGGVLVEYSGAPLAIFHLTKAVMLFVLPLFLITVFWSGININSWYSLTELLKYVVILVIIVIIKNTNPRVRIDQAIKFFWGKMTLFALIAVILALLGV